MSLLIASLVAWLKASVAAHPTWWYIGSAAAIERLPPPDEKSTKVYIYIYSLLQLYAANTRRTGDAVKLNGFKPPSAGAMIVATLILIVSIGCTPLERQAYNTVVGAKAFIGDQKKQHPECATVNSQICEYLSRATSAKDALIDAAEIYCSGPDFETGGVCNAPKKGTPAYDTATAKLKAAIANYNQFEKDVKGAQ